MPFRRRGRGRLGRAQIAIAAGLAAVGLVAAVASVKGGVSRARPATRVVFELPLPDDALLPPATPAREPATPAVGDTATRLTSAAEAPDPQAAARPGEPARERIGDGKDRSITSPRELSAGESAEKRKPEVAAVEAAEEREVTVAPGDSLYLIFKRLGLPQADLARLLRAGKNGRGLARLRPGQKIDLYLDPEGGVRALTYYPDPAQTIYFARRDGAYRAESKASVLDRRIASASGVVSSSLFVAAQRAGLADGVIMQLVEIFGWDVDFALDIRTGDRFSVVLEEFYKDGEKVRDGAILAAEFVNQGRSIRAVRYAEKGGRNLYFSPDGRSMRKAFLRTPVKFSRISSRFSNRRRHPVLHTVRAHRGVDYAAPTGTPIRATGDGKIVFVGRNGGYGKTVIIRHGAVYSTVYAHMSRFARGMRKGRNVAQGDVVGYVGRSGLATGPHLHYEFRVRGVQRNALTVPIPKAASIAEKERADFLAKTRPLVARLELLSRTSLATNTR